MQGILCPTLHWTSCLNSKPVSFVDSFPSKAKRTMDFYLSRKWYCVFSRSSEPWLWLRTEDQADAEILKQTCDRCSVSQPAKCCSRMPKSCAVGVMDKTHLLPLKNRNWWSLQSSWKKHGRKTECYNNVPSAVWWRHLVSRSCRCFWNIWMSRQV